MSEKLVSVYIPTHNRSSLLKRAINSVLNQTYRNIEIIICDDGSSDSTMFVVKEFQIKNKNIVYLRNEYPKGACSARNLGIKKAGGDYITGLDDDDEFLPQRIEEFVNFYENNRFAYLSSAIVFDHGTYRTVGFNKKRKINLSDLLFKNIVGSQVFTKTEYLRRISGFDESFKAWQDYETWVRLAKEYGTGYNIKSPTYIQHLSHEFGRITNSNKVTEGYIRFLEKHSSLLNKKHRKSLKLNYLIATNKKLTFKDFFELCSLSNFLSLSSHLVKKIFIRGEL